MKDEWKKLQAGAERAVAALEALPSDTPFEEAHEAACGVILDLEDLALKALFPPGFSRVSADLVAGLQLREEFFTKQDYWRHLSEVHCEAIDSAPEFAAFLRSSVILERVEGITNTLLAAVADSSLGQAAVERYRMAVAMQLVGVSEFEPAATILTNVVPALEKRAAACRERFAQREHAATHGADAR